jgi:hypothetical protein
MQQAVHDLHTQFKQAETQLKTLRNELEVQIDKEYLNGSINDLNPLNILDRIRRLEQRLPTLQQECTNVLEAKKRAIDITRNILLLHNRKLISQLSPNMTLAELHMDTNEQTLKNIDSSFQKQYQLWVYNMKDEEETEEQRKSLDEHLSNVHLFDDLSRLSNQSNTSQGRNSSISKWTKTSK